MADKQMNQFTTATDGAYIYAEASNGSQVKILMNDLITIIRRYTLRSYGPNDASIEDCNEVNGANDSGIYSCNKAGNKPSGSGDFGILIYYRISAVLYQEYIDAVSGKRWHRYSSTGWTQWQEF